MSLSPGTRLGPYEVLSPLGAGGMGEVYKARDTRLDRPVAVKVLPASLSADAEFRERLDREAKSISALDHPNICALYDVGHGPTGDYLVMQYLEGDTLAARIAKGPLPLAEALRLGGEIAAALDHAHRHGIVHRDLKPGNVMLVRTSGSGPMSAKLLDFGLAKTSTVMATSSPGAVSVPPIRRPGRRVADPAAPSKGRVVAPGAGRQGPGEAPLRQAAHAPHLVVDKRSSGPPESGRNGARH